MKHFELLPREDPDEDGESSSHSNANLWARIQATTAPCKRYFQQVPISWRLSLVGVAVIGVCALLFVDSGSKTASSAASGNPIVDETKQFYRHYDGDLHLHEELNGRKAKKGYHCEFCSDLSGDGTRMVVAQGNQVVIFDLIDETWQQTSILPCQAGPVLSLSRNGKRLAITHAERDAQDRQLQQVLVYDVTMNPPKKLHNLPLSIEHPFFTNYTEDSAKEIRVFPYKPDGRYADFGASLKLNHDGTILAIGMPLLIYSYHYQGVEKGPFVMGSIRVVQWDDTTKDWKPMGTELDSLAMSSDTTVRSNGTEFYIGQEFGHFIGLSNDGRRLVTTVNARLYPGDGPKGMREGIVVFEWDVLAQKWNQMQPILPVSERQYVTMSEDGCIVATEAAENQIRTFAFNARTQQWLAYGAVQVASTIGFKRFGTYGSRSMALSSTGKVLAVAVSGGIHEHNWPSSKTRSSHQHGYMQVFQYQHHEEDATNQWVSLGAPFGQPQAQATAEQAACSDFSSVMISGDAKRLVGQAPCHELVQIYDYDNGNDENGDDVVLDHANRNYLV